MTLEEAVQAYLIAEPYPTALQNRWYKYLAPQGSSSSPNPYGVISRVSPDPIQTHNGPPSTIDRRIQLSVWSKSQNTGATVADAVRRLLNGFTGEMGGMQITSFIWASDGYFYDNVTSMHHFHQDFRVKYIEA